MRIVKTLLAAVGIVAASAFEAPAMAGAVTPVAASNVGIDWSQGSGLNLNIGHVYFAGPISMDLNGNPTIVFCDDPYNVVYLGSAEEEWQTDQAGVAGYLAPLSLGVVQEIAGLDMLGTQESFAATLTSDQGAEIQAAIWELEFPNLSATDASVQSAIDGLISSATNDYNTFSAQGWTYFQLESPCDSSLAGSITFQNSPYNGVANCQIQGEIGANAPSVAAVTDVAVPEPITLSIFGAGIAGAMTMRRRKRVSA
jgi:hypothetical protein